MKKTLPFEPMCEPLPCPWCSEPTGLVPMNGSEAISREYNTLYIKFFCPRGCDPTLVIDGEKADTRMFWLMETK